MEKQSLFVAQKLFLLVTVRIEQVSLNCRPQRVLVRADHGDDHHYQGNHPAKDRQEMQMKSGVRGLQQMSRHGDKFNKYNDDKYAQCVRARMEASPFC